MDKSTVVSIDSDQRYDRKGLNKYGGLRIDYFNIALLVIISIGLFSQFSKPSDLPCELRGKISEARNFIQGICMQEPLTSVWEADELQYEDYQYVVKNFGIRPFQFLAFGFIYAVWVIWASRSQSKYVYNLQKAIRHARYSDLFINLSRALLAYIFISALPYMAEIPQRDFYANYRRELVESADMALSHYGISYDLGEKLESCDFVGKMFNETLYFQKIMYCNVKFNNIDKTDFNVRCDVNLQTYYHLAYGFFFFWYFFIFAWSSVRSLIVFNQLTHIFGHFATFIYFIGRLIYRFVSPLFCLIGRFLKKLFCCRFCSKKNCVKKN